MRTALISALVAGVLASTLFLGWQLLLAPRVPRAFGPVGYGVAMALSLFASGAAAGRFPWSDGLMLCVLLIASILGALAADRIVRRWKPTGTRT